MLAVVAGCLAVAVTQTATGILLCLAGAAAIIVAVGFRPPWGVLPCLLGLFAAFEGAALGLFPDAHKMALLATVFSSVYAFQNFWKSDPPEPEPEEQTRPTPI